MQTTWSRGEVVGQQFRLEEPVPGCGGMLPLWRAVDESAGEYVPVRWLVALDPERRETAAVRATLLRQQEKPPVRSERVAVVTDVGATFAAFDAGPGEPLSALLERGLQDIDEATRRGLALALFEALHDLHAAGDVHGALTPADVAVELSASESDNAEARPAVRVRLVRAGLLASAGVMPDAPAALPYVDGAQQPGKAQRDPRTDLFAAGALAQHLLAGRPLAYGESLPPWLVRCVGPWQERYHDAVAALSAVRTALVEATATTQPREQPQPQDAVPGAATEARSSVPGVAAEAPSPPALAGSTYDADDSEAPRFSVVLREQQTLDVPKIAPLLVEALGMHRIDANRRVRRQQGILTRTATPQQAHDLVERLHAAGIAAEPVGDEFLEPVPKARAAFYVDGYDEGLLVTKEGDEPMPWERVDWVAIALVPPLDAIPLPSTPEALKKAKGESPVEMKGLTAEEQAALGATLKRRQAEAISESVSPARNPIAELPRWLDVVAKDEFDAYEKEMPDAYMDIALRAPVTRYRVRAREMLPAGLGTERTPNWLRNLWVLAHRFVEFLPSDASSPSLEAFLERRPDSLMCVDLLAEFDEAQTWLAYRKRQRELDALLSE